MDGEITKLGRSPGPPPVPVTWIGPMPVDRVNTFLATGAVILAVAVVAAVFLAASAALSPRARGTLASLSASLHGMGLGVGFAMALVAMAGSLYYSEVAGFLPCEYCWYQRIAMYPLVPILGIAAFTGDRTVRRPNYPPSAWLAREGWTSPVIVDDEATTVAGSFGLNAFPFWVFIAADGTVHGRLSGALGAEAVDAIARELAEA